MVLNKFRIYGKLPPLILLQTYDCVGKNKVLDTVIFEEHCLGAV